MLRVAVFVVLVVMVWDVMGEDFTCYPNQTIQFTNPNSAVFTNYRAFYYDNAASKNANCTHMTNDNSVTVIFTCGDTSNNITAYFSDQTFDDDDIIGGAGVKYTFQCAPLNDYHLTLVRNLIPVNVNHTVESSDPIYSITANFYFGGTVVTTATVGQDLTFKLAGPIDYRLKPLLCVAKDGTGNNKILIIQGCTEDDKLVSNFTVTNFTHEVNYDMIVHAFKFFNDDTMTVECSVKICVAAGCDFSCPASIMRLRRALSGNDVDDEDSSEIADFSKTLTINDVALGGSSRPNGYLGLALALMLFVIMRV